MGTIFKYNNMLVQCQNLAKKLKKMRLRDSDISIILDNIPNDILEQTFVEMVNGKKIEEVEDEKEGNPYFYWNPVNNHITGTGYGIPSEPAEWCSDWILIKGKPIFPITIKDGTPCLEN
jgi:hypothetical protein